MILEIFISFRLYNLNLELNILKKKKINSKKLSTIVLIEKDFYYTKSTAILMILKHLKGYEWFGILLFVPKFIRDFVYYIISKNRYLLFGKSDHCIIPTREYLEKFIE